MLYDKAYMYALLKFTENFAPLLLKPIKNTQPTHASINHKIFFEHYEMLAYVL